MTFFPVKCYGHKLFTGTVQRLVTIKSQNSIEPVRSPASGSNNLTMTSQLFRHCPVKFRFYLNFTAPVRCYGGSIRQSGIGTAVVSIHRKGKKRFVWNSNHPNETATARAPHSIRPGIVRCLTSFHKSLNKSTEDVSAGIGQCFSSLSATGQEATSNCIHILLIFYWRLWIWIQNYCFRLRSSGWFRCNEQVLLQLLQYFMSVNVIGRNDLPGQNQILFSLSYFDNLFLQRRAGEWWSWHIHHFT